MLYADYSGNDIIITREDETFATCDEMLECLAYSADVDFIDICNDGYPVNYGNAYTSYDFIALGHNPDGQFRYTIGTMERDELNNSGSVALHPIESLL